MARRVERVRYHTLFFVTPLKFFYKQLNKRNDTFQGKALSDFSVGLDRKRVKEEYDHEEAALRSQLAESNKFILFFRHEPERKWHKKHSNEIMRGQRVQCCVCKHVFLSVSDGFFFISSFDRR